jgi:hypothetical protein
MLKNRILIVTGMHRSGTSVITQWLNRCGLPVGEEMIGTGIGNEDGHFEDIDFFEAHRSLLKSRRLSADGYTDPVRLLSNEEQDTLAGIINYKNGRNQEWGWKDPRTCLFLDAYRALLPEGFYLIVLRDYRAVVSSLIYRIYQNTVNKYASKKGLQKFLWEHVKKRWRLQRLMKKYSERYLTVWLSYNEAIADHVRQLDPSKYIIVDFPVLPDGGKHVFQHLTGDWHFPLTFVNFNSIYKERLVHSPLNIERYIKNKALLGKAENIQDRLRNSVTFRNTVAGETGH